MTKTTQKLIKLVKKAGKIFGNIYGINSGISEKEGTANFVTEYDFKVQKFLTDEISKIFPNAVFISEENSEEHSKQQNNTSDNFKEELCFVIDPIDGTSNFIHGLNLSAISVAMLRFGEPVIGIIYNPYLNELFYAEKGGGAFLNDKKKITVSERTVSEAIVAFGTAPYTKLNTGKQTMTAVTELLFKCADIRRLGSASIDLAYLAAGRFDLFFEFKLSPWDYAAGILIIKEAGGIITDMNGCELTFDAPHSVIAGTDITYPLLFETFNKSE